MPRGARRSRDHVAGARAAPAGPPPPPPPSRTTWTRLVPPSVLTGHVSYLPQGPAAQPALHLLAVAAHDMGLASAALGRESLSALERASMLAQHLWRAAQEGGAEAGPWSDGRALAALAEASQAAMVAALEAELEGPAGAAAARLAKLTQQVSARPPLAAALDSEPWWWDGGWQAPPAGGGMWDPADLSAPGGAGAGRGASRRLTPLGGAAGAPWGSTTLQTAGAEARRAPDQQPLEPFTAPLGTPGAPLHAPLGASGGWAVRPTASTGVGWGARGLSPTRGSDAGLSSGPLAPLGALMSVREGAVADRSPAAPPAAARGPWLPPMHSRHLRAVVVAAAAALQSAARAFIARARARAEEQRSRSGCSPHPSRARASAAAPAARCAPRRG